MAVIAGDIQLSLAYRLGEDSAPNNTNEKARRLNYINEGYRNVMTKHYWWFTEGTDSFDSFAAQESYGSADGVPADLRQIIELRFQDKIYDQISQVEALSSGSTPYTNHSNSFFLFNSKIYPIPAFPSAVTDGVEIKYYKNYTKLTADASTILIPEMFSDILVAYAQARVALKKGKRGTASDAFDEFNELLLRMSEEQNKYLFSLQNMSGASDLVSLYE